MSDKGKYTMKFIYAQPNPKQVYRQEAMACLGQQYTVREGDTLYTISQRYGVPLDAVIAANPQITNPNVIVPGQVICIPSSFPPACDGRMYMVVAGDTLFQISQTTGVPLDAIVAANPQIKDPNVIVPGQIICIPSSYPRVCSGQLYSVKSGDTLFLIARRYGIPLNDLIAANPQIANPDVIVPGQVICIPGTPAVRPNITVLSATDVAPDASGVALINPTNVMVVGFNLPAPETLNPKYTMYKAWLVSAGGSRMRIDMRRVAEGVWMGQENNTMMEAFREIIVTAEPRPGSTVPTGPVVLQAIV
ncbi:MAG: LysM peptidoglycan-binding domain-containing protein [Solirubrobacterales bacterium]